MKNITIKQVLTFAAIATLTAFGATSCTMEDMQRAAAGLDASADVIQGVNKNVKSVNSTVNSASSTVNSVKSF